MYLHIGEGQRLQAGYFSHNLLFQISYYLAYKKHSVFPKGYCESLNSADMIQKIEGFNSLSKTYKVKALQQL